VIATSEEVDSLTVSLASVDAYRQARVEMNPTLYSVRLAIEQRGDKRIVRITSPRPVDDPFLEVMLEINSNVSRVVKNYAILLDPAPLEREQAVISLGNLGAKPSAPILATEPVPEKIKEVAERKEKSTEKTKPAAVKKVDVVPVKKVKKIEKAEKAAEAKLDKTTAKVLTQDKLVLSKTTVDPKSAKAPGLTVEDKIASDKAITDANMRIQELEKNLNDLRKMMEAQNKLLVEQQKMNESLRVGQPSNALIQATGAKQQKDTSSAWVWSFLVLLLLGAGGGAAYYYRRMRRDGGNEGGGSGGLTLEMMRILAQYRKEPAVDSSKASSNLNAESQNSLDTSANIVVTDKEMDPIMEADFYSTSGDSERAEGVLQSFLRIQPDNTGVRMKLLDIYVHRKDIRSFESVAAEFYKLSKGEGRAWAEVAALGKTLDPANPLYQLKSFVDTANTKVPQSRPEKEEPLDFYTQSSFDEHEAPLEPPVHLSSPDKAAPESPHLVDFQAKLKDINFDFLDDLGQEGNKEAEKKKKEDDEDDNSVPFSSDKKGS
jgi:Tfp pilus assembly protein FimV